MSTISKFRHRFRRAGDLRDSRVATEEVVHAPRSGRNMENGIPRTLEVAGGWSWRMIVIAAVLALIGYLIITFSTIVSAFLVAMLLGVLLEPIAGWLRRVLRFPAALAAIVALLGMLVVVVGLLTIAGQSIIQGFGQLADNFLVAVNDVIAWIDELPINVDEEMMQGWIDEGLDQIQENAAAIGRGAAGAAASGFSLITGTVLALFTLFFLLKDGRSIWHWFVRLAPAPARDRINEAGIRGWVTLGKYTRTQIIVAAVDALGIGLAAVLLGVPLVLPIMILVFLLSFIPILGAVLSGAVAIAVALVDQGPLIALIMAGAVLLVQQAESNILQPWLQGSALAVHPLAIVLAVTAGTGIAGLLGAIFAVPVVATINTVMLYLYGRDKYPNLAKADVRPGGPPGSYELSPAGAGPADEHPAEDAPSDTAGVGASQSVGVAGSGQATVVQDMPRRDLSWDTPEEGSPSPGTQSGKPSGPDADADPPEPGR